MSANDDVLADLLALRATKPHRPIDFKRAPHLVWHIGRGNIDAALQFLLALGDANDRRVLAALAHLGFSSYRGDIEGRLNEFALEYMDAHPKEKEQKSTRTIRRWADDGFAVIADLVVEWSEEEGNDRALVEVLLYQILDEGVTMLLTGSGTENMAVLAPVVRVDGRTAVGRGTNGVLAQISGVDTFESTQTVFFEAVIPIAVGQDPQVPTTIEIAWHGPATVNYLVQVHPSIDRHVTSWMVTKKGCEIVLVEASNISLPVEDRS